MFSFVFLCLMSLGLLEDHSCRFDLQLYQITEQGTKQIISSPMMVARNFQTASMKVGQQVPIIVDHVVLKGQKKYVLEQIDVGFSIKLTPVMLVPGIIQVKVDGQFSDVNSKLANVINQTSFTTTLTTKEAQKASLSIAPAGKTGDAGFRLDITATTVKPVVDLR